MDKNFQLCLDGATHFTNLLQRKFARQHNAPETHFIDKFDTLDIIIMHLSAGMQANRRQIHAQDTHILDNQSIDTNPVKFVNHFLCSLQFTIIQNSIQGHKYPAIIAVGIFHQSCNILQTVGGCFAGTECRRTDIYGICPIINGSNSYTQVFCRRQQFHSLHIFSYRISTIFLWIHLPVHTILHFELPAIPITGNSGNDVRYIVG